MFCLSALSAFGQTAPLSSVDVATPFDSGWVENAGDTTAVIWSQRIEATGASWIRLRFSDVRLGRVIGGESLAWIRLTSVLDGHVQTMHARHVGEWRSTSAYFNGDAVDLEIVAGPHSGPCRVAVETTIAGTITGTTRNICSGTDDRVPSTDVRAARIIPIGCTGWLIDDANYCLLTAGHCVVSNNADVVEFNVPPSTGTGNIVHPPPSDQYAIDPASLQFTPGIIDVGEDWAYFGVFENSTTLLTPYEAQGDRYSLPDSVPEPTGQILRKTGFGSTDSTVPPSYNLAQKTLEGPFTDRLGTWLHYPIDSSGGDSGSPVFMDGTDIAYAIHTNGGCSQIGFNSGTSIENADLQTALANPIGVCTPRYFDYEYPNGRPSLVNSAGGTTTRVAIAGRNLYEVSPNSGILHYDFGEGWLTSPISFIATGEWEITFPPMPCAKTVNYYVTFETTSGATSNDPLNAPDATYSALTGSSMSIIAAYDFETATGWFVSNQDVQGGAWARGFPSGTGLFGEPPSDFDGSGQCYLTGITSQSDDVDGGPTRLWSPAIDMSAAVHPVVQYARWFTNSNLDEDRLLVELANNSVVTFVQAESVADSDGWTQHNVHLNDLFAAPGMIRLRFSVADNPNDSRTEAAVDAVLFLDIACDSNCMKGDVNLDGLLDSRDVAPFAEALLNPLATGSDAFCAADVNGDDAVSAAGDISPFVTCLLDGTCP